MKTEAVRVAEIQAQERIFHELINNPIVELLAGIVAISYLNKGSQSWLESVSGIDLKAGGEYAGLVAIIGLQQVAPLIPSIMQGGTEMGKALPGILALGMGA